MRFMQIESVLQTKNRSEPAKNRFSVALAAVYFEQVMIYFHHLKLLARTYTLTIIKSAHKKYKFT